MKLNHIPACVVSPFKWNDLNQMGEGAVKNNASMIGKVLGLVLIIVGFAYGNSGMWMLGIIIFVIGMYSRRI